MTHDSVFAPRYQNTRALVIGINAYASTSPLEYARNDAEAIGRYLRDQLAVPSENVHLLLDGEATREGIMHSFMRLADESEVDDRVFVFFAGHGHTRSGRRSEIGFLVPCDGRPDSLATLIRWDELTRNAELIPAKHVLFVMDACYGGLALTRTVPLGSSRFLKDMLSRYSRQVLTAGKGDQLVSDSGGPRPGHSIFTGHLLDALHGGARSKEGILTANGVMAYVYEKVSKDHGSKQSPHYGFLDGDGDFVFEAPQFNEPPREDKQDGDVLVSAPDPQLPIPSVEARHEFAGIIKEHLSDSRFRIRLADIVSEELRTFHKTTAPENFPTDAPVSPELIAERLRAYERAADRFAGLVTLVACWGTSEHQPLLTKATARLIENNALAGGQYAWLGLRWHPSQIVLYAGGIAALSTDNLSNLATLLLTRVSPPGSGQSGVSLLHLVMDGIGDAARVEAFKQLPGHEKHFVPRSEYLFKTIQPILEDLLYLGPTYEELFDRFEVIVALTYADIRRQGGVDRIWGPVGRFAWKARRGFGTDAFSLMLAEAEQMKADWPLLRAGFFGGDYARFTTVANGYRQVISGLGW